MRLITLLLFALAVNAQALIIEQTEGAHVSIAPTAGTPAPAGEWTTNSAGIKFQRVSDFAQVQAWRAARPLNLSGNMWLRRRTNDGSDYRE